jgi:hypothetical protein
MMTLKDADKIAHIWGRYLEYCSKLACVFSSSVPESFLPFPKNTLEEALNIMAEHYHKTGNKRGVELMQETVCLLIMYKDDEEALLEAAKKFTDPKYRESFIPMLKQMQKDWIKTQGAFDSAF